MPKKTLKDYILEAIPTYQASNALTSLYNAKKELDSKNEKGYDNYAHRLGMCESAQTGSIGATVGLSIGTLLEAKDLIGKTFGVFGNKKIGFKEALKDSKKDMNNNVEGVIYGLTNPEKECRIWLMDLDKGTNTWKENTKEH